MKTFQIDQTVSGVTIGQYEAESENEALDLMTYGELRAIPAGWATSHIINDAFNNARFELGKNFKNEPISEHDLRTIREKAIHFGEPVPSALAEVAGGGKNGK